MNEKKIKILISLLAISLIIIFAICYFCAIKKDNASDYVQIDYGISTKYGYINWRLKK